MGSQYKTCVRYNLPGHAHSLTFSCFHKRAHLTSDDTRQLLVDSIIAARQRHHFDVWAYVIMPDHVHLLIYPREEQYSISTILAGLKRPVAFHGNRLLGPDCSDPFWQPGGGYDRNLRTSWAIHKEIDYLHANPVRKGLCECPQDWRYSSAAFWAGATDVPLIMDQTVPALGPVPEL